MNPYISAIIDIENEEKILHIAARGIPDKNKGAEIAIKLSHLNISDEDEEWQVIEFGLLGEVVTQLISSPGLNIIYSGSNFGNIYKSVDFGETWELIESGLLDNCIMLHTSSFSGERIYASSETKAIRSDDGGKTWEDISIRWK